MKNRSYNKYRRNIGSISSGTMRPEDLIPTFLWELCQQRPLKREHGKLATVIQHCINRDPAYYYDSEDAVQDLLALFNALDFYSLPYFYFGAHPGDGADYGWWLPEDWEDQFDGLQVGDLAAEVPKGYTGEVLHVNDHGDMTLYRASRGRLTELWGIV